MISDNKFFLESIGLDSAHAGQINNFMGIPWYYKRPLEHYYQWLTKLNSAKEYYLNQSARAESEAHLVGLLPPTLKRLENLRLGYTQSAEFFGKISADLKSAFEKTLGSRSNEASADLLNSFYREKVPRQQTLMAYHQTVFRDWIWGKAEISSQTEVLWPFIKGSQKLLILGAGACGLPLALHKELSNARTLAVDINPVLFYIVKKILSGENLSITEFPIIPYSNNHATLEHKITGENSIKDFEMAFADGQSVEFKNQFFDTVLTPWFIDIISRPFRDFARHCNQHIAVGGKWINIGLLGFERYQLSEIHSQDEVAEILLESGFEIEEIKTVSLPYLNSPYSAIRRNDLLLVFSAIKRKQAKKPSAYEYLPEWLRDLKVPIPKNQETIQLAVQSQVYGFLMNHIDGNRSFEDISSDFSNWARVPSEQAKAALYQFFVNFFEQNLFREFK